MWARMPHLIAAFSEQYSLFKKDREGLFHPHHQPSSSPSCHNSDLASCRPQAISEITAKKTANFSKFAQNLRILPKIRKSWFRNSE
jgi:hypothetical protein